MTVRYFNIRRQRPLLAFASLLVCMVAFGCDMRAVDPLSGDQQNEAEQDDSDDRAVDSDVPVSPQDDSEDEVSLPEANGACAPSTRDDFALVDQPGDGLRDGDVRRVGHIVDGDTLDVLIDGEGVSVRFKGMNTPECDKGSNRNGRYHCVSDDEGFGLAAYEALYDMAEGATVRIDCDGASEGEECELDPYDRYLAFIEVPCVGDAGLALIEQGLALTFTRYDSEKLASYCAAEYAARDAGAGFWEGGSITAMLEMMNQGTRSWYRSHDARCDAALEELSNASP